MDLRILCARCGGEFTVNTVHLHSMKLEEVPRRCPACADAAQGRAPQHAVAGPAARRLLLDWDAVLVRVPGPWEEFTATDGDRPCRRRNLKGSEGWGVDWSGRIDLYDFRPDSEALGRVRLMEVTHHAGSLQADPRGGDRPVIAHEPTYQYLAIDPTDAAEPRSALVLIRADRKTTLKGFGRQYGASIDTAACLWSYSLWSACRSGRFGSSMALCAVDDSHPARADGTGDVRYRRQWTLSAPEGADVEERSAALIG